MERQDIPELLKQRDEAGLEALLVHYGPLLRYVAAPILPEGTALEDCISETALRVWQQIARFDPEKGSFATWLTAICRNTALDALRRSRHSREEPLSETMESREPTPEEALLRQERQQLLGQALARLRPEDRTLIYRKYYYRQSTRQMAAELGLTPRAVEGRLYRARTRLQELLGGAWDES